jgi:hypothetical protein
MSRRHHFSHGLPGILGVIRSNPEVIAVFPELSATIIPHAQEIRIRRGDSADIGVQFQNDADPPDAFQIPGGSVLRWAAKIGFGQTEREGVVVGNDGALLVKRSYSADEIEMPTSSRAVIHIGREEALSLPLTFAVWDLEATMPTTPLAIPPGATAMLLAGSDVVIAGPITNWEALGARAGCLITIQGRTVLVLERLSQVHLRVDFSGWITAAAAIFSLSRSVTRTLASGPFVVEGDVVL